MKKMFSTSADLLIFVKNLKHRKIFILFSVFGNFVAEGLIFQQRMFNIFSKIIFKKKSSVNLGGVWDTAVQNDLNYSYHFSIFAILAVLGKLWNTYRMFRKSNKFKPGLKRAPPPSENRFSKIATHA